VCVNCKKNDFGDVGGVKIGCSIYPELNLCIRVSGKSLAKCEKWSVGNGIFYLNHFGARMLRILDTGMLNS
jgi:hypothetical protein